MPHPGRLRRAALVLALALSACSDSAGPGEAAGTTLAAEGRLASSTLTIVRLSSTSDGITFVTNTRQVFRRVR